MASSSKVTADDFDEVSNTTVPGEQSTEQIPDISKANAFTELMKPKLKFKPIPEHTDGPTKRTVFAGRDGLAAYTEDPSSFPQSRVVYHNEKFVVINDLFPKASVHLLILPRDPSKQVLHPVDAFDDPAFLVDCRAEEENVRKIVASELRRKFGKFSSADRARFDAMEVDDPPSELPPGRDWSKEVISGVHANPSMNHLHIHVLSKDMVSECMKRTNHYLSFTTNFLIRLDEFPLPDDDQRRHYTRFPEEMVCWRCGEKFGRKMTRLIEHLEEEMELWKKL